MCFTIAIVIAAGLAVAGFVRGSDYPAQGRLVAPAQDIQIHYASL